MAAQVHVPPDASDLGDAAWFTTRAPSLASSVVVPAPSDLGGTASAVTETADRAATFGHRS